MRIIWSNWFETDNVCLKISNTYTSDFLFSYAFGGTKYLISISELWKRRNKWGLHFYYHILDCLIGLLIISWNIVVLYWGLKIWNITDIKF